MSRINTNVQSMIAMRVLNANNLALSTSLQRLSTGLRINSGRDDPAGLIASEVLRSEKAALSASLTNISRANNVVATAEGALDEVNKLLVELEDLVDRSANEAGISDDEREANQLQIDAILDSITRIASTTEFQGKKLLDGSLDYTTSSVDSADFNSVRINSARLANNSERAVVVEVLASAQVASLTYAGSATGAGTTTLEIQGNHGTETLSFGSATSVDNVALAINQVQSLTGVSAYSTGSALILSSTEYGSEQFVSVQAIEGTFAVSGGDSPTKDYGVDATVLINGVSADVTGLTAKVNTTTLSVQVDLTSTFGADQIGSSTFYVTGGGADFMISPTISIAGMASLGIPSVSAASLGSATEGFLATLGSGQTNSISSGNFDVAQRILRIAQTQVSQLRGRLGAFQRDTLDSTANSLNITLENTTAAESSIRDADFAVESANLTRAQVLVQSATQTLQLANQLPQIALRLLGG